MKLERFEVGAYAVSDRLAAGITGFLGSGVRPYVARWARTSVIHQRMHLFRINRYMVYQI
jgi:hypothetical protein